MSLFSRVALVLGLVSLTACSTFFGDEGMFRSRGKDYLSSGPIKPIDVPDDMQVTSLEALYVVPTVQVEDDFGDRMTIEDYDVPRPREFSTDKSGVAVKIQSQLDKRWIFLNASTAQVWPQTQSFLSENTIAVTKSDASSGLIETDWIQFKADLENRSKFRIEIAKGIHTDTTEVHVRQVQIAANASAPESVVWPAVSDSAEREKYIVSQLANALAQNVDNKAASLMGQNVGGADRVSYASVNGEPQLRIRLPWSRAYASLSASLKSDAFSFWEQDGERKLFFFGYTPMAYEEKGWFSKLAFWRSDEGEITPASSVAPFSLETALQHLDDTASVQAAFGSLPGVAFGEAQQLGEGYIILVSSAVVDGDEVQSLIVRDFKGRKVPVARGKEVLRKVRSNLI